MPRINLTLAYLATLLLLALPSTSLARLGDSELKCESRYGRPVKRQGGSMSTKIFIRTYHFEGWEIEDSFVNRHAVKQVYRKLPRGTVSRENDARAIVAILESEAGNGTWRSRIDGEYIDGIDAKETIWRHTKGRMAILVAPNTDLIVYEKGAYVDPGEEPKERHIPNF